MTAPTPAERRSVFEQLHELARLGDEHGLNAAADICRREVAQLTNPTFSQPVEGFRDAVAFARALTTDDRNGAFEVWKGRTDADKLMLACTLAHLLGLALPDGDEGWLLLMQLVKA